MPQDLSYCPLCEEIVDHPEICTVCGEKLVAPPPASQNTNSSRHVSFLPQNANSAMAEWETPTAEAMDPQQAHSKNNPTSQECLNRIPRIIIDATSAILYEASIEIEHFQAGGKKQNMTFDATIGEFPPHPPFHVSGELHLSKPIHGLLPLSPFSLDSRSPILYMERGGAVTFVQKAKHAKSIGAKAVICGNHVPIWPYIMKDSTKIASSDIPILMVKRSDGHAIKDLLKKASTESNGNKVRVKIEAKKYATSCIICTEGFQIGSCVTRLPLCGHVFHEDCCMSWLTKHNTCPFCRRELPAENSEYESERRRVGRSHAGAADGNEGLAEDQWDQIFG